ncbi:transmembrane protein, putative [Medicago truncatula]|uniref:Transmembrane protein, putative n=1 Tax=Medicago truncatula TaxID=3880 RepID=G7KAJ5_MEDTR|nr:transmembrane protein, putative [Medicago truncatula]
MVTVSHFFLPFSNFFLYLYIIIYQNLVTLLYSSFFPFITGNIKYCFIDTDCPRSMCHYPEIVRCVDQCKCVRIMP